MKPINLAHVLGSLDYGGVESLALDLLKRLSPNVVRSSVYYIGESIPTRKVEFEETGAPFVHCPYSSHRRRGFITRLASLFRERSVDAVLCYCFGNHAWVCMAAHWAGVRRSYVTVQSSPTRDRRAQQKNFILSQLARPFCSGEIAASKRVRQELIEGLRLPEQRVVVIENACAVKEIAHRAQQARSQRLQSNVPVVLMVSRMDDAKDHTTLIKACASLIRSGLELRLRFAGDGPAKSSHEALCNQEGIQNSVEFLGTRTDIPELLGKSDVAVLSTRTEGFAISLIEAMSARTPVIATDIPACREVLDSGRCGVLVAANNPEALADSIRRLIGDRALADPLVHAGYARVAREYDIERALNKYTDLLADSGKVPRIMTEVA